MFERIENTFERLYFSFYSHSEAAEDAKKERQYEALEQQLKQLVESYSEATQQLGQLKESVDESKDLLKANMVKEENADGETDQEDEENEGCTKIDQDCVAIVVEMQGIFQQSDIRNEELASLESMAGLYHCTPVKRTFPSM